TNCLDLYLNTNDVPISPMHPELVGNGDIQITRAQNRNYSLADGFDRMAKQGNSFALLMRYKAQAERHYRRAVEDFERLKAQRQELQNEPISDLQPNENEPDYMPPAEPFFSEEPNPQPPAADPEPEKPEQEIQVARALACAVPSGVKRCG